MQGKPRKIIEVISRRVKIKPKGRNGKRYLKKGMVYLPARLIGKRLRIEVYK